MTEVLSNGTYKPRIIINDEGDPRAVEDFTDLFDEDEASEPIIEDLPHHERGGFRYERPATLEDNIVRIRHEDLTRHAIRPLTAYEELGGGLSTAQDDATFSERPLDGVIRTIGDKVPEVREAVERFGLNEFTLVQYEAMSDTQKKHFIVAFQKFYNLVLAHVRRIRNVEGDVRLDHTLMKYHDLDETPEQVTEYGHYLEALLAAIDETGIPKQVEHDLQTFYTNELKLKIVLKNAEYQKYQMTFRVLKNGHKEPMRASHRLA